jgi:hypothetical protein
MTLFFTIAAGVFVGLCLYRIRWLLVAIVFCLILLISANAAPAGGLLGPAIELNCELAQLQNLLSPDEFEKAKKAIYELHSQDPGVTSADAARMLRLLLDPSSDTERCRQ